MKPAFLDSWTEKVNFPFFLIPVLPIILATAMAFGDGIEHFFAAFIGLLFSFTTFAIIELITILKDDDDPFCAFSAQSMQPRQIKIILVGLSIVAGAALFYLLKRGGLPLWIITLLAIVYTVIYLNNKKTQFFPLLDFKLSSVFIFFGPLAVTSTYYVQSFEMNFAVFIAGIAMGLLALAIYALRQNEILIFLYALIIASLLPVFLYIFIADHVLILFCPAILLFSINPIKSVLTNPDTLSRLRAAQMTIKLFIIYVALFCVGWIF